MPLSYVWHDERLLIATSSVGRSGRSLAESAHVRAAIGDPRDLVIVAGTASVADSEQHALGRVFEARLGFGPADVGPAGRLFILTPRWIQSWVDRADGDRWIMHEGRWTT